MKICFLIVSLLIQFAAAAQDSICHCSTYSMLQYANDYDHIFPPAEIKANHFKEVTIYTTAKRGNSAAVAEYKEMIFRFNAEGYVSAQILFNGVGRYHSMYEFHRDYNNKVITKTFQYLDENGDKPDDSFPDKWIYVYSNYQLVKVKKLDYNYSENPDNQSDYTMYTYDDKGRETAKTWQIPLLGNEPIYYETRIKYNDTTHTSVATTNNKKQLFSKTITQYTGTSKPLTEKLYDGSNKLIQEKKYTYNSSEQLIEYQEKNLGMASECPGNGTFTNTLSYTQKLIAIMRHRYENTTCSLRFDYK